MKIDVHAHYLPDGYRAALHGQATTDQDPDEDALASGMVGRSANWRHGVESGSPGRRSQRRHPASGSATELVQSICRRRTSLNEDGRRAVVDHPGRFGLLATLPLPDVDAAITEIAYCCDHLNVDGFVLLTNVSGTYVSGASFESMFRELQPRGARVLLHPTSPACWEHTSFDRPRPMLRFFFDTTRAVVDLVLSQRHRSQQGPGGFIIPHAGATLPLVVDRGCVRTAARTRRRRARDLARVHFDLAGGAVPRQLDDDAEVDDARPPALRERLPLYARAGRCRRPSNVSKASVRLSTHSSPIRNDCSRRGRDSKRTSPWTTRSSSATSSSR